MTQQELFDNHAGFNRFTEAYIICKKQIGARRSKSTPQWFKLVRLKIGARAERGLESFCVGVCHRSPSHGINERTQPIRIIERIDVNEIGQSLIRKHRLSDL
ncbi:hypothetical protein B1400_1020 [Bifidobacterium italicum]|uniref:Uncharacterized protein n=1 Tax=Bifidobacterium italicum TaxID=1960968 RepID=A0A2A2EJC0_9BIFI|nr:hypothetical protein B1400_1020 [Bifidobacterium italicum]